MEYEVQKVVCTNCNHQRILSLADAEELGKNFICRVCHWGDGKVKIRKTFEVCGACGQTMWNRHCWCKNTQPYSKVVVDPFHKWTKEKKNYHEKKLEQEIEMGKVDRLMVKKQIEIQNQPLKIQKEILAELKTLNNPKKEELKPKKFECEAIK